MEGGGFKRRRGHQQQAEHLLGVDIGLLEHVLHDVKHNHLGLLLAVLEGDVDLASLGLAVPHGPPCCTADILCQQVASIRDPIPEDQNLQRAGAEGRDGSGQ